MCDSFFSARILFFFTILLICIIPVHASTIIWKGNVGATDWHTGNNWIGNEVPTIMDSVIITGGAATLNVNVLISNDAEARHIKVDDHSILSTLQSVTLRVGPVLSEAVLIEKEGSLINFGNLVVFNAINGMIVKGTFENHGDTRIAGMENATVDYDGIMMSDFASVKNFGFLLLDNLDIAISLENDARFENEGTINIEVCKSGISTLDNTFFENKGRTDFSQIENFGIFNIGTFINSGPMLLNDAGRSDMGAAIFNLAFGSNGYFENNSNIVMADLKKTGIRNAGPADFFNTGIIIIQDALEFGLVGLQMSTFTVTTSGSLVLPSTTMSPLDIDEESVFDIAVGAVVTIKN